jgi:hypothetical protein
MISTRQCSAVDPPLGYGFHVQRFPLAPCILTSHRVGRAVPQPGASASASASATSATGRCWTRTESKHALFSYVVFCIVSTPSVCGTCACSHADVRTFANTHPQLSSLYSLYTRAGSLIFLHGPRYIMRGYISVVGLTTWFCLFERGDALLVRPPEV